MILTDEQALRIKCEPVSLNEVCNLRDQLDNELNLSAARGRPGIGLAAPQIGIGKRMAVIRLNQYKIDLVNPEIVQKYNISIFDGEGCLSFPDKVAKTMRYQEIVVKNDVEPNYFIAQGLLSVVIQHEIDHLNNILLPDVEIKDDILDKKVRPNDPCVCGSGKKYKKCCKV